MSQVVDDEDDMPPLEYIGDNPITTSIFCIWGRVTLKGLDKAQLKGQQGTILPSEPMRRLPVELDASRRILLIKPDNLA